MSLFSCMCSVNLMLRNCSANDGCLIVTIFRVNLQVYVQNLLFHYVYRQCKFIFIQTGAKHSLCLRL